MHYVVLNIKGRQVRSSARNDALQYDRKRFISIRINNELYSRCIFFTLIMLRVITKRWYQSILNYFVSNEFGISSVFPLVFQLMMVDPIYTRILVFKGTLNDRVITNIIVYKIQPVKYKKIEGLL